MWIRATNGQNLLITEIPYFGRHCLAVCDYKCEKAWGISGRPSEQHGDDPDDVVWFADDEVSLAPADPGSYEGGHGKPLHPARHNKWCVRECERSAVVELGQPIQCPDLSHRKKHGLRSNPLITTDTTFYDGNSQLLTE
jgi:hypothetical protein